MHKKVKNVSFYPKNANTANLEPFKHIFWHIFVNRIKYLAKIEHIYYNICVYSDDG